MTTISTVSRTPVNVEGRFVRASKKATAANLSLKSLEYIAKEFETHVVVDDRRYHLKTYRDCFIGHEAVSFLLRANFAPSRPVAVVLGRRLAKELDLFEHVTRQHEFKDDFLFIGSSKQANVNRLLRNRVKIFPASGITACP